MRVASMRLTLMCCRVSCKTWAFSCPSHIVIDSISNPHCPNSQAWGLLGNMFKLFHLNLCPPTKTDCLKTAKKLVPVLRSNYSSAGENKWRSNSLVMFHFIVLNTPLLSLHFKVHDACRCLKQCLIIKCLPLSPSPLSVYSWQSRPHPQLTGMYSWRNGARFPVI